MSRILVVDDVAALAEQYAYDLKRLGAHEVVTAISGDAALKLLDTSGADCVILDLEMPGMDGFGVLSALRHRGNDTPVIVYTGTGNFDRCIEAVRLGAAGFIDKAEPMERVVQEVEHAIERYRLRREVFALQTRLGESVLLGRSAAMEQLKKDIARVAPVQSAVLVTGESGTGKELVARELHRLGAHPTAPLIALNCAALPENLVESELFGHERGAFTGAVGTRKGAFESAGQGTLFLDEIGEMPLATQPKLLRVLQEHVVTRVGASATIKVSARVVAATNRDLDFMVKEKEFREDLFYRLNVHVIRTPPLRERREDIALLAERFVEVTCREFGILPRKLAPEAREALVAYDWKRNNVRELRNAIERAIVNSDGEIIRAGDLPQAVRGMADSKTADDASFQAQRTEAERKIVLAALEKFDGHITKTAESLDLADHASLLKIMRRLGISRD
jgi:two-component system nitrogen regulation response regulator NtrX